MCGICGYVGKKRIEDDLLAKMRDTMVHRGPNDAGLWQGDFSEGFVGLAHRRLSIFDLSDAGHQPMHSENNTVSVVFNGEIYNFKSIRNELEQKGYSFKSECDTEVILAAYSFWSRDCFSHFNGMFAIAIWDSNEKSLILARDRMGVKPLYYWIDQASNTLVFGSELKPIMTHPGYHKDIRVDMIGNYLCNKYIAAPNTIFKDTYKMEPGTYAIYKDGAISIYSYWSILQEKDAGFRNEIRSYENCLSEIESVIKDSVQLRLAADVPVGAFLSSGIDSTLITALAREVSNQTVKTYTIGFYDKERNEANEAEAIARHLGTDHTQLYIGEDEIYEMIKDMPYYYDEPFSDSSQLPTMLLSKMTSDHVTVAISGDGGDELFCGYKMYDWTYWAQKLDWIGNIAYHVPGMNYIKRALTPEVRAFINNRDKWNKTQLFTDVMIETAGSILNDEVRNAKYGLEKELTYPNWQERRMLLDMMTYLPDEVMAKTDRASMKYSLEVRSPLLDHRVVETTFRIPHKYKYHGFGKKAILKNLTYKYVPRELLSQKKKGFGVPLKRWLRTSLSPEIEKYAEKDRLIRQGFFDPEGVENLMEKQRKSDKIMYSSVLWSFYVFQRWYESYYN